MRSKASFFCPKGGAQALADPCGIMPPRWRGATWLDPMEYQRAHADLRGARIPAWLHWLRHGRREGRWPCSPEALVLETALWQGEPQAADRLLALVDKGSTPAERLAARLVLARAAAMRGEWQYAAENLGLSLASSHERDPAALPGLTELRLGLSRGFNMPEPMLLAALVTLRGLGKAGPTVAALLIRDLRRHMGEVAGVQMLEAAVALHKHTESSSDHPLPSSAEEHWHQALRPLYESSGLEAPALAPASAAAQSRFDRLTAQPREIIPDGPLVSVIIPARDAENSLETALSGLIGQSWRQLEIIVVDNGSCDRTPLIIHDWMKRDPRIRLINGGAEPGAYAARNLGVSEARGSFIAFHDADDWSHPDRISRQVAALTSSQAAAALVSWVRLESDLLPAAPAPTEPLLHPALSSLMLSKDLQQRLGFWDRVRAAADSEYLERIMRIAGPTSVASVMGHLPLAFGRAQSKSLTRTQATGIWGPGAIARATYIASARAWHAEDGSLYLPCYPKERPFPAPAALLPSMQSDPQSAAPAADGPFRDQTVPSAERGEISQ